MRRCVRKTLQYVIISKYIKQFFLTQHVAAGAYRGLNSEQLAVERATVCDVVCVGVCWCVCVCVWLLTPGCSETS